MSIFIRFSVLPALSLTDGFIYCDIVEGSYNAGLFYRFISNLLNHMCPYPQQNSVIVMDNCRIHKHPEILALIESRQVLRETYYNLYYNLFKSRGMRCEFLPPYSPDFNPIELAFSAMKYHLCRKGELVRMVMTDMSDEEIFCTLLDALYESSLGDVFGWFRHCGYV